MLAVQSVSIYNTTRGCVAVQQGLIDGPCPGPGFARALDSIFCIFSCSLSSISSCRQVQTGRLVALACPPSSC